ncbi:hypothetical protein CIK79_11205 [Brevibacterium aurantiacum]|uniref:Uncharacterized protein n=1 Tax=Brevibacterium aurantiacum TaxID=273384 RepID=A0A2A3X506_BREAU|nr:hypothetical protein CIK79_11205 [Brevibacterium aurantiacum]
MTPKLSTTCAQIRDIATQKRSSLSQTWLPQRTEQERRSDSGAWASRLSLRSLNLDSASAQLHDKQVSLSSQRDRSVMTALS